MQFIVNIYLRILGLYYIPTYNKVLGTLALKYINTIPIKYNLESLLTLVIFLNWSGVDLNLNLLYLVNKLFDFESSLKL